MDVENFTTYTEVDTESRITKTATRITAAGIERDDTGYVYFDKETGYFTGDFEHLLTVNISDGDNDNGPCGIWALWNTVEDWTGCAGGTGIIIFVLNATATDQHIHLREYTAGVLEADYTTQFVFSSKYLTIERDTNTINVYVYNDASRTDLFDTITVGQTSTAYRYIYGLQSLGEAPVSTADITCYSENLDLQEIEEEEVAEEGGMRLTFSLRGRMGYDLKTRGGKARRRIS